MSARLLLSVVVPARDEAEVLPELHCRLSAVLSATPFDSEIVYVDDGSTDGTWDVLAGLAAGRFEHDTSRERSARVRSTPARTMRVYAVRLSRSFGHQAALTAGIDRARGEAVITIDADLQDPPELIPELVAKWREGFAVVHARRTRRLGEALPKRAASFLFHRILRRVADVPIRVDVADFRLLDRSACDILRRMPERHRYLRGLAVWTGLPEAEVQYERQARAAGRTKYRLRGMMALALDAMTAFSTAPLRVAAWLGAAVVPLSLAGLAAAIFWALRGGPWWPTAVALLALLDGVVLLLLGVLGAYVARVGDEARARPLYVVQEEAGSGDGLEPLLGGGAAGSRRTPERSGEKPRIRRGREASGGSARSARRT